jgi:hypothetical protein
MRAWATVVLTAAGEDIASWPLSRDHAPDLAVVDALARAQLVAKRFGWTVRVRDAVPELVELVELAGVDLAIEVRG